MKKLFVLIWLISFVILVQVSAEDDTNSLDWYPEYRETMNIGDMYLAVIEAVKKKAPACDVFNYTIKEGYTPFAVLKAILVADKEVSLDEICNCSVQSGVEPSIIAKAFIEAGIDAQEVSQSECLRREGLAYTPAEGNPPPIIPVSVPPPPVSPTTF